MNILHNTSGPIVIEKVANQDVYGPCVLIDNQIYIWYLYGVAIPEEMHKRLVRMELRDCLVELLKYQPSSEFVYFMLSAQDEKLARAIRGAANLV